MQVGNTDITMNKPFEISNYDPRYIQFIHNYSLEEVDFNAALKSVLIFGIAKIPGVGEGLALLLDIFWPQEKENLWEKIKDKVEKLIDQNALQIIELILSGDIKQFEERIKTVNSEILGKKLKDASNHYMNIAEDLVGFEKKFIFADLKRLDKKAINLYVLPLYSTTVLMKVSYYITGIQKAELIGLNESQTTRLKKYLNSLIHDSKGVNYYIKTLNEDRIDATYDDAPPDEIFDAMMYTRSFAAINGLEYIPIWNKMVELHSLDTECYVDVISYSKLFGRQTPDLAKQAIAVEMTQPLTPDLLNNGQRNKIKSITGYIRRIGGSPRVGGGKIIFENGTNYQFGTITNELVYKELNGALINNLVVYGNKAIDEATFYFSDGSQLSFGERAYPPTYHEFKLSGHHIVSFYITSDAPSLAGQAANIAVAYQLTNK